MNYSGRNIEDFIAHRGPMRLIERIVSAEDRHIEAKASINSDNIFYNKEKQGVPSWVGLEYLAQTAAAWVGVDDERQGRPIALGFLLGSRSYKATNPVFSLASDITMKVHASFIENSIIVFDGEIIDSEGKPLANGNLTAFRPDDVNAYLKGSK